MTATLEQLRAEHRARFIGPELLRLLERVASATARSYPPSYSDAGVWNEESVEDALHDWVSDRLYGRRDLTNLLAGANSVESLRRGLTTSFGQYLVNKHQRTSVTNLYGRIVKLLRSDADFEAVGNAPKRHDQLWTLFASPQPGPSTASLGARLRIAAQLTDADLKVVTYKAKNGRNSSPVLRKDPLKRFVAHLLSELGALTPADIIDIMRRRFGLVEPGTEALDDSLPARELDPLSESTQRQIARSIAARVGRDDAALLATLDEYEDLKLAAQAAETDTKALKLAFERMRALALQDAVEPEELRQICGMVLETLRHGSRNSV